jgi:hypothetical protein
MFFHQAFVYNYCPLAFMMSTGKNITPTELKVFSKLHLKYCFAVQVNLL